MTRPVLPSPTSLAHAVRYGGRKCADLAREYGVTWQAVHDRLERGGFDTQGSPIEHQAPTHRPRLKDADNGYTNHVGGGDRVVSTNPVVHGGSQRPRGHHWSSGRRDPVATRKYIDDVDAREEPTPGPGDQDNDGQAEASREPRNAVTPPGGGKLGPHAQEIIRRYTDGESSTQLAADFGCTPAAITALLHRHDVPVRSRTEAQRAHYGNSTASAPASDGHKVCVRCTKRKPVGEFPTHKLTADGRAGACRDCLNKRPPTETRAIRNRARNRAYSGLAARHEQEFQELLQVKTAEVTAEFDRIRQAAGDAGDPVPRLKPGPKRRDQSDVVERLDVARCRTCHTHHDADHVCPTCGDGTPEEQPRVPPYEIRAWARAEGLAPVPPTGPLPKRIVSAYLDAHADAEGVTA